MDGCVVECTHKLSYVLNCMLAELITLEECGTQYVLCNLKALVSYNVHKLLHDNRPKTYLRKYSVATLAEKWAQDTYSTQPWQTHRVFNAAYT